MSDDAQFVAAVLLGTAAIIWAMNHSGPLIVIGHASGMNSKVVEGGGG